MSGALLVRGGRLIDPGRKLDGGTSGLPQRSAARPSTASAAVTSTVCTAACRLGGSLVATTCP